MNIVTVIDSYEEAEKQMHEQLSPYITKAKSVAAITEFEAPLFLKNMVDGIFLAGGIANQFSYYFSLAKTECKRVEAVVKLEEFPVYVKERGIKGTVNEAEAFVDCNPNVLMARDKLSQMEALYAYAIGVKNSLVYHHDDAKKTIYSSKDYDRARGGILA